MSNHQNEVLLKVENLKKYFKTGKFINKAVDDVSFEVRKGEVFGLVGESGCGKTTCGRTIINLYDPTGGSIYFKNQLISDCGKEESLFRYAQRRQTKDVIDGLTRQSAQAATQAEKDDLAQAIRDEKLRLDQTLSDHRQRIAQAQDAFKNRESIYRANRRDEIERQFIETSALLKHRMATAPMEQAGALRGELEKARQERDKALEILPTETLMTKMQMIFQDPIASINPRMTVREIIAEGLKVRGIRDKAYLDHRVHEMLNKVGLVNEHADRYPHEFSGGQRQRIGIARALILDPELIIADEPISALDVSIQAQVINLLNDLRESMGLTILFIAHNLSVVKYFSDRIAVMYYGKIVELADSEELFSRPTHPYTKSLLSAIPYPDPHYERRRKREAYVPALAHDYAVDKPTLREVFPGHFVSCNDHEYAEYLKLS
jgi:oligopeptide transport system ATP-binding protein